MSDTQIPAPGRTPTVYFIDDSATMREVIKIAFRKESIQVITCADAAAALAQFLETPPDAVITDVIMPDKDGYEVCEFVKRHEEFGKVPVILMSGVVNRTVAERAMAVKADELIRKPFQPQELIVRVKKLLNPHSLEMTKSDDLEPDSPSASVPAPNALSSLFGGGPAPSQRPAASSPVAVAPPRTASAPAPWAASPAPPQRPHAAPSAETHKLRNEVHRLELLVKKLQAELEAQHQYCAALEAHIKTLQESE
ncbi:MAG TPA: response regulator [Candidatus Acidoferrum sp.]|nr:response regulator [Candidatus Acidoferrum sp.]